MTQQFKCFDSINFHSRKFWVVIPRPDRVVLHYRFCKPNVKFLVAMYILLHGVINVKDRWDDSGARVSRVKDMTKIPTTKYYCYRRNKNDSGTTYC